MMTAASTGAWPRRLARAFAYTQTTSRYASLVWPGLAPAGDAGERIHARVVDAQIETPGTRSLILRTGRGWLGHQAGQFVTLYVNIDGVWQPRCYSISSSEAQTRQIRLTIRAMAPDGVSHYLVHHLPVGARVQISQAAGEFTLAAGAEHRARLFISAGSGITPIMGMLASGAADGEVEHLHYARNRHDLIFGEALGPMMAQSRGYRLHARLTEEGAGHLDAQTLDTLCPDWRERETWVCGPAAMLRTAEQLWAEAGIGDQLHVERFAVASFDAPATDTEVAVQFAASGRQADASGATPLLEVAEAAGLRPRYGCRMGICHSCDCVLRSGAVRDLRTGKLTNTPGVRIQPCVSAAAGPVTLDL